MLRGGGPGAKVRWAGVALVAACVAAMGGRDRGAPAATDSSRAFRLTFYWLTREADAVVDGRWVTLHEPGGRPIGVFPERFLRALRVQGSGVTRAGAILGWVGGCPWGARVCFEVIDRARFPFGRGASGRPLAPYRSIAVDPSLFALGTRLWAPALEGVRLPGGFVHDGCLVADDVGKAIRGAHVDLFAPAREAGRDLARRLPRQVVLGPDTRCGASPAALFR